MRLTANVNTFDNFQAGFAMAPMQSKHPHSLIWRDSTGKPISCIEKVKVLRENHEELRQQLQDCFEDALLMGCDERQFRQILEELLQELVNPYNITPPGA